MKIILILFQLATQQFLLMQPIERTVKTADFGNFRQICTERISVHLEEPFTINGYFDINDFIEKFSSLFSKFETRGTEWSSYLIGEDYAIQSLNLLLREKKSEQVIAYKFVFFMSRETVNIVEFVGEKNQIIFEKDPVWEVGGEFDVTGSLYSGNNGRFKIKSKRGTTYQVDKLTEPLTIKSDRREGFKAKAWKLYYLKGIEL